MGAVNRNPSLNELFAGLERRIKALESSRRFTIPVIPDWTYAPDNPQSGDMIMDAENGFVFVFCVDGETTSTAAATVASGAVTLTVGERKGFKPNQSVAVEDASTGTIYLAVVSSAHVAATGAGTIAVTFVAPTVSTPTGLDASVPANSTNLGSGSILRACSWRQIVTTTDLIAKQAAIAAGTLSTTSFSGQNSTVGSNTGGMGERISYKGYSPHA